MKCNHNHLYSLPAVKSKCKIDVKLDIIIKDENGCKISDSVTFVYFMLNHYKRDSVFEISTEPKESPAQPVVVDVDVLPISPHVNIPPIYEDPDKFFVYFLSKVKYVYSTIGIRTQNTFIPLGPHQLFQTSESNYLQTNGI